MGGVGRVGGVVCTVIFVSNPSTVEVVLRLSWGFDNIKHKILLLFCARIQSAGSFCG